MVWMNVIVMFICVLGFENLSFLLCILGLVFSNGLIMKILSCMFMSVIMVLEMSNKSCSCSDVMLLVFGVLGFLMSYLFVVYVVGLFLEDKLSFCEVECEKEFENVWWDYNMKFIFWIFYMIFLSLWYC